MLFASAALVSAHNSCFSCAGGTSGSCQKASNKKCYSYVGDEKHRQCPSGALPCRDLCGNTDDGKDACVNLSWGPCQAADGVCSAYQVTSDKVCSPATENCRPVFRCTDCAEGSKGTFCQSPRSGKCYPYKSGDRCPSKTVNCGEQCHGCVGFSTGPCKSAAGVCSAYNNESKKTCSPSTWACYGKDNSGGGGGAGACDGCVGYSTGPCKAANNVCSQYIDAANQMCAPATWACDTVA